ncbi:hypothetical protein [Streptomyces sp. CBMA29]|uniref:hypothetical protein n=1 Tax=Streptomyces sp. CBMA29 TaxID=1896314 RepID=UPI001661E585|nr:hypothetical protein [Streptomyces sp. CBMA29]MBD0734967.1 hypothetical protein [Streptomyces sp. CBMA29]
MPSRRSALIIAGAGRRDPEADRPRAPEPERLADAAALADALRDPGIGGFDVTTLLDARAEPAEQALTDFFADRADDDLLLLHVSAPGAGGAGGAGGADGADGEPHVAGVAASRLNGLLDGCGSRRIVLLLDCSPTDTADRLGGRGRTVISASDTAAPSGLTHALAHGLRTGEADGDRDGLITLGELYAYVRDQVREAADVHGELLIAWCDRPAASCGHRHEHPHHHLAVPELELPDVPDAAVPAPPTPGRVVLSPPSRTAPGVPVWRRLWRR